MPYTVNPAASDEQTHAFASDVLESDLRLCETLGADVLVLHPGSHKGEGMAAGVKRVAEAVKRALADATGRTRLLFEAMAGSGNCVGGTPDELAALLDECGGDQRLGVCLDSCHQYAAGYDLTTPEGVDAMVDAFARAVGLDRISCLHLNDCKSALGSHLDRHERIGKGRLGVVGIRAVVNHPFLRTLPMCLETPVDDLDEYAAEIAAVHKLTAPDPRRP